MQKCTTLLTIALLTYAASLQPQHIMPAPPTVEAKSYILMEAESKKILTEFNSREKLEPASLTKIMTSYVVASEIGADRIAMEDMVQVSVTAWKTPGSRMFIKEGTTVSVGDLLRGVIVQSGNDASVALAEHIAGTEEEFANLMNEYGQHLGLEDTNFRNSTGLSDEGHLSTALDKALLTRALILDFPEHYKIYSEREFTYGEIEQKNRNRLLRLDESADGVKTGFTSGAGYCLVASAKRNGLRLISVIMGAESESVRTRETQKLLNYGFRNFEMKKLAGPEDKFSTDVKNGKVDTVQARLRAVVNHLVPRSELNVRFEVDVVEDVVAPVEIGDEVGNLKVILNGEEVGSAPLFAQEHVEEMGFFQGIFEAITGFFSTKPSEDEEE